MALSVSGFPATPRYSNSTMSGSSSAAGSTVDMSFDTGATNSVGQGNANGKSSASSPRLRGLFGSGIGKGKTAGIGVPMDESPTTGGGRISPPPPPLASGSGPTPPNTSTFLSTSSPISPLSFSHSSPHSPSEDDYYTQEYLNSVTSSAPASPQTRIRTTSAASPRSRKTSHGTSHSPVRLGPSLTRLEIGRATVYCSAGPSSTSKLKVAPSPSSLPTPSVVVQDWNVSPSGSATTTTTMTTLPTTKPKRPLPPSPPPRSRVIFPPPSISNPGHKTSTSLSIRYQPLVVDPPPPPPTIITPTSESGPKTPVVIDAVSPASASPSKSISRAQGPAIRPLPRIPIVGSSESSSSSSPSTSTSTSTSASAHMPSARTPSSACISPSTSRLLPPIPRQKSPKARSSTQSTSIPSSRSALDAIPSSWASRPVDLHAQRPVSPPSATTRRVSTHYGLRLGAGAREKPRARSASRPRQSRKEGESIGGASTRDGSLGCLGIRPRRMTATPPPTGSRLPARSQSASDVPRSHSRSTISSGSIRTIPTTAPSLPPKASSPKFSSRHTSPTSARGISVSYSPRATIMQVPSPIPGRGTGARPIGLGFSAVLAPSSPACEKDKGKEREETSPKLVAMAKLPRLETNFPRAMSPPKPIPAASSDPLPASDPPLDVDTRISTEAEERPFSISLKRMTRSDASHIAYFDPDMDTDVDDYHVHPISGSLSSSSIRSVDSKDSRSRNQTGNANANRTREPENLIFPWEQTGNTRPKSQSLGLPSLYPSATSATKCIHLHPPISPISLGTDDSPISPLKFFVGRSRGAARNRDFDADFDMDLDIDGEDEEAEGTFNEPWDAEGAHPLSYDGEGEDLYREAVGEVGLAIGGEDEDEGGEGAPQPYVYSYEYGWGVIVDENDPALLEGGEEVVMTGGRSRSPSPIRYARRRSALGSWYGRSVRSISSSSSVSSVGGDVAQLGGDRSTESDSESNTPLWSWRLGRTKMQKGHLRGSRTPGGEGVREGEGKGKENQKENTGNEAKAEGSKAKKIKEKERVRDRKKSNVSSSTPFTSSFVTETHTRTSSPERGRKKHPMKFSEAVSHALERRGGGKDKEKEKEMKDRDREWQTSGGSGISVGLGSQGHSQRLRNEDGEVLGVGASPSGSMPGRKREDKRREKGRDGVKEKDKDKSVSAKSSNNFLWGRKKPKPSDNSNQTSSLGSTAPDVDSDIDIRTRNLDKGKDTHHPALSPFMWVSSPKPVVAPNAPPGSRKSLRQSSSVSGDLRQHYHRHEHRQSHTHTHSSSQLEFRDRGSVLEEHEHGSTCFSIPLSIPIRRGSVPEYSPVRSAVADRPYKREGEDDEAV